MKLTKQEQEHIKTIIHTHVVVSVREKKKKIWDCSGLVTRRSKELHTIANIESINTEQIVKEIFNVLGDEHNGYK